MNTRLNVTGISSVIKVPAYPQNENVFISGRTFHELYFNLAPEKEAVIHYNGVDYRLSGYHILFLPAGVSYRREIIRKASESFSGINIYFESDQPLSDEIVTFNVRSPQYLQTMFNRIELLWSAKKSGYYLKSMSVLYEIIAQVISVYDSYNPSYRNEKIRLAVEYLHDNIDRKDLSMEQMAEKCGMSYSNFRRTFQQVYGISCIQYYDALKIEKAKDLLVDPQISVTAIAEALNYESVFYFCRCFKKTTGVSPTEYRKQSGVKKCK